MNRFILGLGFAACCAIGLYTEVLSLSNVTVYALALPFANLFTEKIIKPRYGDRVASIASHSISIGSSLIITYQQDKVQKMATTILNIAGSGYHSRDHLRNLAISTLALIGAIQVVEINAPRYNRLRNCGFSILNLIPVIYMISTSLLHHYRLLE